ncbi:MAG: glycosyltransferase [Pirellulales bacterium]|nr:glycosyltransferase [Pirellulales bacterium]
MGKIGVALCITELDVGGAERCLVELATRLDRDRFEPLVCVLARHPADDPSLVEALTAAGIETHFLGGRRNRDFLRVYRLLKRLLIERKPDVVQGFLFHANILSRLAARAARVPRVVSGIRVAQRHSRWRLRLDRWTDRLVDRHVCVSQSVAQFCRDEAGLPSEKLVVIPNGVDAGRYLAAQPADLNDLGIPPERRLIAFVGRLERQKGVKWLVETAPGWLGPLTNVDLVLVGQGPQQAELERIVQSAGLAGRVHFLGFRPDVPEMLARSTMLVLPSAWEGMPNAVLEAMASGLPVVATDVEGVAELLGPAAPDQMIEPGSAKDFAAKVFRIMRDPAWAGSLGRENRRRATEQFSLPAMVAAYEGLWRELVP